MPYIAPARSDLVDRLDQLLRSYNHTNPQRQQLTTLLAVFAKTLPESNELIAMLIFASESIAQEYQYTAPGVSSFYGYVAKGSRLYTGIQEVLQLSARNVIDDAQRLVFLGKLRLIIMRGPLVLLNTIYQDEAAFQTALEDVMLSILQRSYPHLVVATAPTPPSPYFAYLPTVVSQAIGNVAHAYQGTRASPPLTEECTNLLLTLPPRIITLDVQHQLRQAQHGDYHPNPIVLAANSPS